MTPDLWWSKEACLWWWYARSLQLPILCLYDPVFGSCIIYPTSDTLIVLTHWNSKPVSITWLNLHHFIAHELQSKSFASVASDKMVKLGYLVYGVKATSVEIKAIFQIIWIGEGLWVRLLLFYLMLPKFPTIDMHSEWNLGSRSIFCALLIVFVGNLANECGVCLLYIKKACKVSSTFH